MAARARTRPIGYSIYNPTDDDVEVDTIFLGIPTAIEADPIPVRAHEVVTFEPGSVPDLPEGRYAVVFATLAEPTVVVERATTTEIDDAVATSVVPGRHRGRTATSPPRGTSCKLQSDPTPEALVIYNRDNAAGTLTVSAVGASGPVPVPALTDVPLPGPDGVLVLDLTDPLVVGRELIVGFRQPNLRRARLPDRPRRPALRRLGDPAGLTQAFDRWVVLPPRAKSAAHDRPVGGRVVRSGDEGGGVRRAHQAAVARSCRVSLLTAVVGVVLADRDHVRGRGSPHRDAAGACRRRGGRRIRLPDHAARVGGQRPLTERVAALPGSQTPTPTRSCSVVWFRPARPMESRRSSTTPSCLQAGAGVRRPRRRRPRRRPDVSTTSSWRHRAFVKATGAKLGRPLRSATRSARRRRPEAVHPGRPTADADGDARRDHRRRRRMVEDPSPLRHLPEALDRSPDVGIALTMIPVRVDPASTSDP